MLFIDVNVVITKGQHREVSFSHLTKRAEHPVDEKQKMNMHICKSKPP